MELCSIVLLERNIENIKESLSKTIMLSHFGEKLLSKTTQDIQGIKRQELYCYLTRITR